MTDVETPIRTKDVPLTLNDSSTGFCALNFDLDRIAIRPAPRNPSLNNGGVPPEACTAPELGQLTRVDCCVREGSMLFEVAVEPSIMRQLQLDPV